MELQQPLAGGALWLSKTLSPNQRSTGSVPVPGHAQIGPLVVLEKERKVTGVHYACDILFASPLSRRFGGPLSGSGFG